jgi:hypothetical protein
VLWGWAATLRVWGSLGLHQSGQARQQ